MERLDVPEFLRCDHHSSLCFDVAPFLVDLDGGKPFRETIGEVELWRNDGFSVTVDEAILFPEQPAQLSAASADRDPCDRYLAA
jgi:hypothetical protein